jgi:hypothetical protein
LCVSTAVVQEDKDKKYAEICPGVIVHSAVKTQDYMRHATV